MRESIGGAFLLKLMVVFIVLYNSLLAIAVNYAIAFRVKNQIVNLIEQYEGCAGAGDRVKEYVSSVGYYRAASPNQKGYSVEPRYLEDRKGTYYIVTTYIKFDFPFIQNIFKAAINGETKIIYGVKEGSTECSEFSDK